MEILKKLQDCKEGDLVRMWCIGWNRLDNEVVKVKRKGILIEVEYKSGRVGQFF